MQTRLALAQAHAAANDLTGAIASLEAIVDEEPRVAAVLAQYQERNGQLVESRRHLQQGDRGAADEPRAEVPPHRRAAARRRNTGAPPRSPPTRASSIPRTRGFRGLHARAAFDGGDKSGGLAILESARAPSRGTFPRNTRWRACTPTLAVRPRPSARCATSSRSSRPTRTPLNYLGYLLAKRGEQLEEAVDLVRRALVAEPDNGAFLDSLGWAYFRKGDPAKRRSTSAPRPQRLPKNSEVQDHLGDVYARRARWQDADRRRGRAPSTVTAPTSTGAAVQRKINDARSRLRR